MAFTRPAPNVIESDVGYRVKRLYPYMRYVEGDRSARVEIDSFGTGGNEFLGIPGDGVVRWGLYPRTIKMESVGDPFTAEERLRMIRRIMAAYESEGMRIKVVVQRGDDAEAYYASEA